MKKFISFVMAAAMVASLVPATAFAKGDVSATVKVVDSLSLTKDEAAGKVINETHTGTQKDTKVPELQMTITNANYRNTEGGAAPELEVTVTLDNAEFVRKDADAAPTTLDHWKQFVSFDFADRSERVFTAAADGAILHSAAADKDDIKVADLSAAVGADAFALYLDSDRNASATGNFGTITFTNLSAATQALTAGDPVKLTKASNPDVVIGNINAGANGVDWVTAYNPATNAGAKAIVEKLQDGYAFENAGDGAAFVTKDNANANADLDDITGSAPEFTVADQITELGKGACGTYARGNYLNGVSDGDVELTAVKNVSEDQVTFVFTGEFAKDDVIIIDLFSKLDKSGVGKNATVSVDSNAVDANDLVYASVKGRGITATTRKVGSIAEEEFINLETDIKVSSTVGDLIDNQWFELKLSKGFEFNKFSVANADGLDGVFFDGNTAYVRFNKGGATDGDTFIIDKDDVEIESTSAKSGSTCTMTVKALKESVTNADGDLDGVTVNDGVDAFTATTTVEILKVVDYKVQLSVDEDEDVPVIYSGVNVDNYGITDDSDHWSLEVTAKETFPGAWSMRKGFNFELPEHVYVADIDGVDVTSTNNFYWNKANVGVAGADIEETDVEAAFWNAYRNGSHLNFEFDKRVFDDVDSSLRDRECAEMTFKLKLVADPGFEGDVVLKLTGDLVDEQEVTIAKFVKPYEVKAEQNDLIIDYRYTDIPTSITITEAEKGLWAKNEAEFRFGVETGVIQFEDDPTFEIDSSSDLEIKNEKASGGVIRFTVKAESNDPATVTIKDMQLFMQRSIPAGPYDLLIASSLEDAYLDQVLFAPDHLAKAEVGDHSGIDGFNDAPLTAVIPDTRHHNANDNGCEENHEGIKADSYVGCVADYSDVVKEAFVNVVTAGRDVDDASFTTKVVVPVGENYIVAGEKQIELDTPAYINAAGYTMLPIRAVATALGINNSNVLWDQPTKTVTILYGQRIITMTQGQKVVYVNGSAIPASAAVENTNSRTFLPMRDLATALGVTDITWDQATRTATLNGNQK